MTVLTTVTAWTIAAGLACAVVKVLGLAAVAAVYEVIDWCGEQLERLAERFLERRHRTAVDRLARHARHQEETHG